MVEGPEHGSVHSRRERLVERAKGGQLAPSGEAPDTDHAVVACRQYLRPVGAENCGIDLAAAGVELRRHLIGAGIEDGHVAGIVGQDNLSSIGAELPVPDNGVFVRVLERTEVLVGVALAAPPQAPLPRRAIVVSDEHAVAGGVEGHTVDEIVVARCSGELDSPAVGEVDDLDDVVVREADSNPGAVRADGNGLGGARPLCGELRPSRPDPCRALGVVGDQPLLHLVLGPHPHHPDGSGYPPAAPGLRDRKSLRDRKGLHIGGPRALQHRRLPARAQVYDDGLVRIAVVARNRHT